MLVIIAVFLSIFSALVVYKLYRIRGNRGQETIFYILEPYRNSTSRALLSELERVLSRTGRYLGVKVSITHDYSFKENAFIIRLEGVPDKSRAEFFSNLIMSYRNDLVIKQGSRKDIGVVIEKEVPVGFSPEKRSFFAYRRDGSPVTLSEDDIVRHVGVFGATGSGKTTTVAVISKIIFRDLGFPVFILDWHGEYCGLLGRGKTGYLQCLDPLEMGLSLNPVEKGDVETTMNILDDVLELSSPQSSILYRIIKTYKPRDIFLLMDYIESSESNSYWDREVKHAILRKMEFFDTVEGKRLFGEGDNGDWLSFRDKITVVDVSRIRSIKIKKIFSLLIIREHYLRALERGIGDRGVLVIDEAHNVLPRLSENFVSRMIAEVRKFGISFILSTQSPSSVNIGFLKNLNTRIIHSIKNSVDKELLLESIPNGKDFSEILTSLRPGEAVYSPASSPESFIITINDRVLGIS
jgi:DNA helicase HerA-like ATPase